jgi:hypothetical protein
MKLKPFRTLWLNTNRAERERWAKAIGTSYGYLQKLAGEYAIPSADFALRMQKVIPRLDVSAFGIELGGQRFAGMKRNGAIAWQPAAA